MLATGPELPREWLGIAPDSTTASPATPVAPHRQSGPAPIATPDATLQYPDGLTLPLDGSMTLDDMEECIIRTVLERHNYNVMAAVRALGTTRETLRYRIRKYGLEALVNA
jgi:transcriptional regulator with GAF, ATPase, and Fis domain